MASFYKLNAIKINGYRPFGKFEAQLSPLEIFVGANGSGKSSFFEFLRFLRDASDREIPPEIVADSIGQQIFHVPGPEKFEWEIEVDISKPVPVAYLGELLGPKGRGYVSYERVVSKGRMTVGNDTQLIFLNVEGGTGFMEDFHSLLRSPKEEITLKQRNRLALSTMTSPTTDTLYNLRKYISDWRFYNSINIANDKIRRSVPIQQEPVLHEDCGNLSSVLHYLMTEHRALFDELELHLKNVVPGFKGLTVKARGGPGEVIAFWKEDRIDQELSLADVSDGILRLICWFCLCMHPKPPSLICIDEPDQGVHPRTLPVLAGLLEKASSRTQIMLATHSSYFLTQFKLENIGVFKKADGEAKLIRPADSKALKASLEEFGSDEIEAMHRSDELESL